MVTVRIGTLGLMSMKDTGFLIWRSFWSRKYRERDDQSNGMSQKHFELMAKRMQNINKS